MRFSNMRLFVTLVVSVKYNVFIALERLQMSKYSLHVSLVPNVTYNRVFENTENLEIRSIIVESSRFDPIRS